MITMPTWVFFLLFVGGVAWNVYLMWANDQLRHDLRAKDRKPTTEERELGRAIGREARVEDGILWYDVPRRRGAGE